MSKRKPRWCTFSNVSRKHLLQYVPPPGIIPKIQEGQYLSSHRLLSQVLLFAEKKADVDAIHEYLLLKGVEAVAIHGGKGLHNNAAYEWNAVSTPKQ